MDKNIFTKFVSNYTDEELLKKLEDPSVLEPDVYTAILAVAKQRELISEFEYLDYIKTRGPVLLPDDIPEPEQGTEIPEGEYWKCPVCNNIIENGQDKCWNCQIDKTAIPDHPDNRERKKKVPVISYRSGATTLLLGILFSFLGYYHTQSHSYGEYTFIRLGEVLIGPCMVIAGIMILIITRRRKSVGNSFH
jgi:hypothetical protein